MPGTAIRQTVAQHAQRVVVKVGTGAITASDGTLDCQVLSGLAEQIAALMADGKSVTLVASGAVGAGIGELGLPGRPTTLPQLQAAAAVGQGQLMRSFHDLFAAHGVKIAQVLVGRDDFADRRRYLNIRNTLTALGEMNVLPILNENDAVVVDELKFGDNDIIAALVANILIAGVALWLARPIAGLLGSAGSRVTSKLAALLLAAIAVMFIRRGITEVLQSGAVLHP
ncbi:MAG: glutamate 5-kinase [Planctomycetota bacterium]